MPKELKVIIVGDASQLNKSFGQASASAQGFGSKMERVGGQITSVGKKLTLGVTTPLVVAGVASFKMAEDFETSMSRVIGLAGQSEKQVDSWSKKLLVLGPQLGKSPRELAEALYFVASSGVSAGKALDVVTISAKASSAGLGDTQQVADALTSVMNAYGEANITAARAADVLVATVREGKGEAADFAPVIGNVTSFASQLGVSFEEVGAALASMTRLGVDASTAATQLQGVFSNLVRPTKQVQDALKGLGLTQKQVVDSLQNNGLLATLKMLKERTDGNTKALIPLFGNIRALRGVFALVGNQASVVEGVFKRMGDSTGSLATAFEASTKRTGFTMEKFKASIEATGIAIGTILAPIVEKVAIFLTRMSLAFQNLDPKVQQFIIAGAAIAAVLGPVLIIIGTLVGSIGALVPVFVALASPIGIVVAAIVLLTAALVAAVLWPDKLQAALQRMGFSAKDAKSTVDALRNAFTAIKAVVDAVWPAMQAIIVPALQVIKGMLMIVSAILRGDFSDAWKGIKIVIANELKFIVAILTAFPRVVLGVADDIGKALFNGFKSGVAGLFGYVSGIPGRMLSALGDLSGLLYSAGVEVIQGFISGITSKLGDLWGLVGGIAGKIRSLKGPIEKDRKLLVPQGSAIVEGLINGMKARLPDLEKLSSGIAPSLSVSTTHSVLHSFAASVPSSVGAVANATAAAGGNGAMAEVHTHVYLDSTQIAEVIRREYLRFEKRNGRTAV